MSHLLPEHKWIGCRLCYGQAESPIYLGNGNPKPWKVEGPNGAWGSRDPKVVVLGFSRGATQKTSLPYDEIPFRGMRPNLTKILQALRLLRSTDHVSNRINSTERDFHFGSFVRCSVAMWDARKLDYAKSGNGILQSFVKHPAAGAIAKNCTDRFLKLLPSRTRLIVLLGNEGEYMKGCFSLLKGAHRDIERINPVAYGNKLLTWVHTVHAKALGSLVPQWTEGRNTTMGRKLRPAQEAVTHSGVLGEI